MRLTDFLRDIGRPVAYYPQLAKCFGSVKSALFACQMIYWSDKAADARGVYKTSLEIENETGLNYEEQKSARRVLKEEGILIENYERLNHRMFYLIDLEKLNDVYDNFCKSLENNEQGKVAFGNEGKSNSRKPLSHIRERGFPSVVYTENTSETTSEKTTTTADHPVVVPIPMSKKENNDTSKTISETEPAEIVASIQGTKLSGMITEGAIRDAIQDYRPEIHAAYQPETRSQGIKRILRWMLAVMEEPRGAPITNPAGFLRARAQKGMDKPAAVIRAEKTAEVEREKAERRRKECEEREEHKRLIKEGLTVDLVTVQKFKNEFFAEI